MKMCNITAHTGAESNKYRISVKFALMPALVCILRHGLLPRGSPVSGVYYLGTPLFAESVIALPGGKTFTIRAKGLSDSARYIRSATLNGKPLEGNTFAHSQLAAGGVLELEMTDTHK